jgi:hypothetical protein
VPRILTFVTMKNTILFLLVLCLNLPVFAAGEEVMFVNGTVTDKQTNETLAGVEVRVKGTSIVAYTDFDGKFFLPSLPAGTYELEFHYITYTSTLVVTDNCDHCTTVEVQLDQPE